MLQDLAAARRARPFQTHIVFYCDRHARQRKLFALTEAFVHARRLRSGEVAQHGQVRADRPIDRFDVRERCFGDLSRTDLTRANLMGDLGPRLFDQLRRHRAFLLCDDARHSEKPALPLRCLSQNAFAVKAGAQIVFTHDVAGLDHLSRCRDALDVELRERVYVTEQIAELPPEDLNFLVA